jgi:hypothetical protein
VQGGVAVARRAATPLLALVLAVLTWRQVNFMPVDSLDPSWQSALHTAFHERIPFKGLVFTYGPLGFLAQAEGYYSSTVVFSALYVFGVQFALCAALISALRRPLGMAVAAIAALVLLRVARDLGVIDAVVVVVVVVAFALLRGDYSPRTQRFLVAAGGVLAGTHLLVKLNTGVTILVVGAAAAWFLERKGWLPEAMFLSAAAGSLVAAWLFTGNGLSDLVPFFDRSWEVASGYSEAMAVEKPGREIFLPLAAGAAVIVAGLGWRASRDWPLGRRIGLGVAAALWLFAAFKLGFVRHDRHDIAYFGEVLLVGAVLAGAASVSWEGVWKASPAVATAALVVVLLMASGLDLVTIANPGPQLARAGEDVSLLASSARREQAIQRGRTNLRSRHYHLTPSITRLLRGHTVHIRPWEASIAWAYPEFQWQPVPVFQEYTAYTADLDDLDAAALRGANAPERILTQALALDLRNPDWESPAAAVAIFCHYRELLADSPWQVLGRVANRCGTERSLGVVRARVGEAIAVPPAPAGNEMVLARINGLDDSLLYGLRSTLWRAPEVHVRLDGGRRNRLVPGTAPNGVIVRSPQAQLGFSQPFAPDSANVMHIDRDGGIGLNDELSIEFVAVPVLN